MPNSYMQLGPIVFQEYEVPSSVRFGGRHRVAVRTLSGGARAIERLGPDDNEVQFDGVFSGPDAEIRAVAFDELRLSGQAVWLAWQSFRRLVVVKTFIADYHSPWWISYKVSCVVVRQALSDIVPVPILQGTLGSDLSNALAVASSSGVSITPLQLALSSSNVAIPGTLDQRAALETVEATLGSLNSQIDDQSILVTGPPPADQSVGSLSDYVTNAADSAGILASAAATRCYVGRIGVNLNG